jgi:hypothetical protein
MTVTMTEIMIIKVQKVNCGHGQVFVTLCHAQMTAFYTL